MEEAIGPAVAKAMAGEESYRCNNQFIGSNDGDLREMGIVEGKRVAFCPICDIVINQIWKTFKTQRATIIFPDPVSTVDKGILKNIVVGIGKDRSFSTVEPEVQGYC